MKGMVKMKIRKDFVTNSSSTSYTCSICGYSDGGFNVSPEDCNLYECYKYNHTVCKGHLDDLYMKDIAQKYIEYCRTKFKSIGKEMTKEFENKIHNAHNLEEIMDLLNEEFKDDYESYQLIESICPICNFSIIDSHDRDNFRKILLNLSDEEVDNIIHSKFKTYDDFIKFIGYNFHKVGSLKSNLRDIVQDSNCKLIDDLIN